MRRNILMIALAAVIALSSVFIFITTVPAATNAVSAATAANAPSLTNNDCAKCHSGPPADIASAGGKHAAVGCTGCHSGHPPAVQNNIPNCSQCHSGKPHYELKGCLGCHRNPHTPRKVSFDKNVTDACLTCHAQKQIRQLKDNPSKHTQLHCSTCHDVHGKKPACTQCHKPHAADMTAAECKNCHRAHMPKVVTYASDVPTKDCAACHAQAASRLSSSKAKHKALTCATCHQDKHKMIPRCQDCHGEHHPAAIMQRFPRCGQCHHTAHDLNHWPAEEEKSDVKKVIIKKSKTK